MKGKQSKARLDVRQKAYDAGKKKPEDGYRRPGSRKK